MKIRNIGRLVPALAATLLMGCSSSGSGNSTDGAQSQSAGPQSQNNLGTATGSVGGPGTYVGDGPDDDPEERISATVFAPPDHPLVRKLESFRAKVAGPRLSYVLVVMDNRNGTVSSGISAISIVSSDGLTVEYPLARDWVGEAEDKIADDNIDLYNEAVAVYNSLLDQDEVLPGAVKTAIFVAEQRPRSVKNVFAQVGISGTVQLHRK